jgi:DnaJ-class molecular chaperone
MKFDYYEELEISHAASIEVIKAAYKRLSLKYHPDNKETGEESKFKRLNEAYVILSDESKRKEYDRKRQKEQETQNKTQSDQESREKCPNCEASDLLFQTHAGAVKKSGLRHLFEIILRDCIMSRVNGNNLLRK